MVKVRLGSLGSRIAGWLKAKGDAKDCLRRVARERLRGKRYAKDYVEGNVSG